MARSISIEAQLVLSHADDHIAIVADGQYLIVHFQSQAALDRFMAAITPENKAASSSKSSRGGPLQALADANELVRALQLVVDIRVGGKTYLELGGTNYRITASAVLGKLGSFFKRP